MQTPQVLDGRYRLRDRLGSGGMSVVWRAHDRVLNRDVAVKVLDGPYAAGAIARERIRAEAQAAAGIWHANVTNVFDYGEATGEDGEIIPYVVMELMPGRTLADRLTSGPLPPRAALRICAEVASGLAAAHAIGLVHRDVKPANVMLTPSGAKVFDFGIAALIGGPEVEHDGRMLGTPAYLAPERLTENIVIPASDVYALGLLIYRTLTGDLPWNAETSTQMFTAHIYLEPAPLPAIDGVDDAVNEVCARCLAKDPSVRPSAGEVAAILADVAGITSFTWDDVPAPAMPDAAAEGPLPWRIPHTVEIRAAEPAPDPVPITAPPRKRRRAAWALLAGVVAVISIGTVIAADRGGSASRTGAGAVQSSALGSVANHPASSAARTGFGPTGAGPVLTSAAAKVVRTAPATGRAPTFGQPSFSPSAPASAPATIPTSTAPATIAPPPTAPPPPRPTPPRASPTGPSSGTAVSDGGTIRFTCTDNSAMMQSAIPKPGWLIGQYQPGPATNVKVVFVMLMRKSEIDVHCDHGTATTKIKESK